MMCNLWKRDPTAIYIKIIVTILPNTIIEKVEF